MLQETAAGQASLTGALDMQTCPALLLPLTQLAKASALTLNLSNVTAADSAALALLLAAQRAAEDSGNQLVIQHWPKGLSTLLDLYSMNKLFLSDGGI